MICLGRCQAYCICQLSPVIYLGNVCIGNELSATLLALVFFILLSGTEGKSINRQVDVWFGVEKRVKKFIRTSDERFMSTNIGSLPI